MLKSRLLSRVPNVRHGFSTRSGGVSEGAYASLNLGRNVGDDPERVEVNRARFLRTLGEGSGLGLAEADQVHGVDLVRVDAPGHQAVPADALSTTMSAVAVAVRTADCAPVLMARVIEDRAVEVTAVHAGWRGAVSGIVTSAIRAVSRGDPSTLRIAIGPAIGPAAFEVGEEVIEAAQAALGGRAPPHHRSPEGRARLDLRQLLVIQLADAGIRPEHVELVGGCTFSDDARYFSHRRDRGLTGRHLSAIAIVPG